MASSLSKGQNPFLDSDTLIELWSVLACRVTVENAAQHAGDFQRDIILDLRCIPERAKVVRDKFAPSQTRCAVQSSLAQPAVKHFLESMQVVVSRGRNT